MGRKALAEARRSCLGPARGRVLEVGFGSGRNLPYYPPAVKEVVGIDPSAVGATLARRRIQRAAFRVECLTVSAEQIDAPDGSFDTVVSTFTLCSIPDALTALQHMRRLLSPGGRLLFVEHGRAPDPSIRRWQDRLTPAHRALFGGCHLNRDIEQLVTAVGFEHLALDKSYAAGPRLLSFFYRGTARPRACGEHVHAMTIEETGGHMMDNRRGQMETKP